MRGIGEGETFCGGGGNFNLGKVKIVWTTTSWKKMEHVEQNKCKNVDNKKEKKGW